MTSSSGYLSHLGRKLRSKFQKKSESESCSVVSNSFRPPILQARILEWVAVPFSMESSQPRDRIQVSRIAGKFFSHQGSKDHTQWSIQTESSSFHPQPGTIQGRIKLFYFPWSPQCRPKPWFLLFLRVHLPPEATKATYTHPTI